MKGFCRADEVVVITKEDLPKRVAEITQGRGAYAVINPIGGEVNAPLAPARSCQVSLTSGWCMKC